MRRTDEPELFEGDFWSDTSFGAWSTTMVLSAEELVHPRSTLVRGLTALPVLLT